MSQKGFTLIEILLVVAIVAVLCAVAVPQYRTLHIKAFRSEALLALGAIHKTEVAYFSQYDSFTDKPMQTWDVLGDVYEKMAEKQWSLGGPVLTMDCADGLATFSCGYYAFVCRDFDGEPELCVEDDSFFVMYNMTLAQGAGLPNDGRPFHLHDDLTNRYLYP